MDAPSGPSPLILFADDFEDARDMYGDYLTSVGYRVDLASSGEEAVHLSKLRVPDIILLDIEMRGMSGAEALGAMRKDPRLTEVPIIAFTAHALERELAAFLIAGFDGVIPKPCLPDDLVTLVQPFLAKRRQER